MYTFLKNYLDFNFSLILNVFFMISIFFVLKYQNLLYPRNTFDSYVKEPLLFLSYLDKYYIKNKIFTFSSVYIYIMLHISIIFYVRFLFLGHIQSINVIFEEFTTELSWINLVKNLVYPCSVLLNIILYYILLNIIFFNELLKIYIYLAYKNGNIIYKFINNINNFDLKDILWGPLYLIVDCIHRLTPEPDDYYANSAHSCKIIYDNIIIRRLTLYGIKLNKKNVIFYYIIILTRKILRFCYRHLDSNGLLKYIPYILIISITFYDFFINKEFIYIYYGLFFVYFIQIYLNYLKFIGKQCDIFNYVLHEYFYKNEDIYIKHRLFILKDKNKVIISEMNNEEYWSIFYKIKQKDFIKYIINDLTEYYPGNITKKLNMMYIRYIILITTTILSCYQYFVVNNTFIYYKNINYTLIILIFLLIIWIINHNIYRKKKDYDANISDLSTYDNRIYNYKFEVLFWIFLMFFYYIIWLYIFKAHFFIIYNDIILDYFNIQIKINYTLEEKYNYFQQYLDYYLTTRGFTPEYKTNFMILIENIDLKEFINDHTTMKDIKMLLEDYCNNYILIHNFLVENIKTNQIITLHNPYIHFIITMGGLLIGWNTIIKYLDATNIVLNPTHIRFSKLIDIIILLINKYK